MTPATVGSSAAYAAEVARLLWPDPWQPPEVARGADRSGLLHRDSYIFPNERQPRLLLPADVPASATMLQRLGTDRSALLRPARHLLQRCVRSKAFTLARWPVLRVPGGPPDADSIERYLSGCFGIDVRVGVMLGTRRVNQKPVLAIFDRAGGLHGYAKVGHNDLTAELVRSEARSLATVAAHEPRTFRLPAVLHHGRWAGLEVLVISPLVTRPRRAVTQTVRVRAMAELARLGGTRTVPLAQSGFWTRVRRDAALLTDRSLGARLEAHVREIEGTHGAVPIEFGSWHGDWGRWNMGMGEECLQVWDWERYDAEVPVGFDALHFAAQSVRPGEREERRQEAVFLGAVRARLTELGVDPSAHCLTLHLYLLEVGLRYAHALTHGATPALARRVSWVLSLVERMPEPPPPISSGGQP